MTTDERMMEVAKLRLRFRMNSRLRLETLAMLSRVFREHQEPIADELLSSMVFAVPDELMGEAEDISGSAETYKAQNSLANPSRTPPPNPPKNPPPNPPKNPPPNPPKNPPPNPPKNPPPHPPTRKS